jgi:TetR/AcrR family transcriptional repressor of mexJK operon
VTKPKTNPDPDDGGRSARKRRAIMEAATAVFLANGYLGTSMDEIAARAAVSKQTVYKHFDDKERLFCQIVLSTVSEASDPNAEQVLALGDSKDFEADLRALARRQLARVMQPRIVQLRRLVIGEAGRFPQLGKTFYEEGPGRTVAALAKSFGQLAKRRLLTINDPETTATHFNWLVMSAPINRAMLLGDEAIPSPGELDRYADAGVEAFIAAYGQP